jgi:hypothetical protein
VVKMNKLIDEMTWVILEKGEIQNYQIELVLDYLKSSSMYKMKNPLKIEFPDKSSTDMTIETLREWVKVYKISPTTCKSKDEYEQKLLAMRI